MTVTQRLEKNDYFGQPWASSSPSRAQSAQSPGAQYLSDRARAQIRPGANNSFNTTSSPVRGMRVSSAATTAASTSSRGLPQVQARDTVISPIESSQDATSPSQEAGEERTRRRRAPSQKVMLSQALSRANAAVLLDNDQKFASAIAAYEDACDLLQQVMHRSSGGDDRRKLEAIRNTYKNRIRELQVTELGIVAPRDKALPKVPVSPQPTQQDQFTSTSDDNQVLKLDFVPSTDIGGELYPNAVQQPQSGLSTDAEEQSFSMAQESSTLPEQVAASIPPIDAQISSPWPAFDLEPLTTATNGSQTDRNLKPGNLSAIPSAIAQPQSRAETSQSSAGHTKPGNPGHQRLATMESTSWLDTIEESGGSSNSSVHSRSSSMGLRRKHLRSRSGDTEAEFDAALDAAVEAAYDDGYELVSGDDETYHTPKSSDGTYLDTLRKNVDLAKQRVRDAERETALLEEREAAILAARERERKRLLDDDGNLSRGLEDPQAEAEEYMLDVMARHYILEQDEMNQQPNPLHREPAPLTRRTIENSSTSIPTMGANSSSSGTSTAIATPAQDNHSREPAAPPPTGALPLLPINKPPMILATTRFIPGTATGTSGLNSPGVRDRRLSGQNARELTINTAVKLPYQMAGPKTQPALSLGPLLSDNQLLEGPKSASFAPDLMKDSSEGLLSPISGNADHSEPTTDQSPLSAPTTKASEFTEPPISSISPNKSRPALVGLRKNFSSSSLKSLTRSGAGTPGTDDGTVAPVMRIFSTGSIPARTESMPTLPDLPTPGTTSYTKLAANAGSLSYLDIDIHSPRTPGSPNVTVSNPPMPLEPCPESFLLRPFWLMRALYQTIAHPRGGYISTRLFIPRDAWRVMNVKLKNIDEKVANCDFLTAALLKLAKVDTLDADAVLEQMQEFELVLDQAQGQLNKKLGAEVGSGGSAAIFKSSPIPSEDPATTEPSSRASTISSKSYLSWKRLRSKNSMGAGIPVASGTASKSESKDFHTIRTLPMTTSLSPCFTKRDPTKVLGIGPYSHYMASLGRLCDAVQILDQIARQVEDPGLRLSSQTHVGLELCIRHAADFFAFFICRFALNDIGMMLDKFVKRGSEWVLV